jgi:lysyl-tRNA synthetase class 2
MKRMLAGGFAQIFQIARSFRRDEQGPIHEREFAMLEWYRAFSSLDSMIAETELLVEQVAVCAQNKPELTVNRRQIVVTPPFERVSVSRIFSRAHGCSEDEALALALSPDTADQEAYFRVWAEKVDPLLSTMGAVVLTDFAASHASLARKKPGDPRLAERFEIVVGGVELCNGFCELIDPIEQRQRFESDLLTRARLGLELPLIDEKFLAALAEGIPPCSGNALGLDRLVALALGTDNIADVMAFSASEL